MRKLSIRMRLTLVTLAVLTIMAGVLTLSSVLGSAKIYGSVVHDASESADDGADLDIANAGTTVYAGDTDFAGSIEQPQTTAYAENMETAAEQFQFQSLLLMFAAIILGGVAAWFVLGFALRPFAKLTAQVEQVSAHELGARIAGFEAGDELSRLAEAFNHTLGRLEEAFALQKQFSSAAAHELKTPIAAIKANIEVLAVGESPSPAEYEEVFAAVARQTGRMADLVEDLFLISANSAYAMNEQVNLREMAQEAIAEQGETDIFFALAAGSEIAVQGNAAMLSRAVCNLVENAAKYNKPGGRVTLSITRWDIWAEITVEDTGIGIPPEHLPHIFEPFYRVDASRSRKIGGSGLGLAIARDTAERHGGTLSVASVPGEGSTFRLRLPIL